jgi:hypothetical protein
VALACLGLVAVCAASTHWVLSGWATMAFWPKFGWLMATIAVAGTVFIVAGLALKIPEMQEVSGAIRRRLKR